MRKIFPIPYDLFLNLKMLPPLIRSIFITVNLTLKLALIVSLQCLLYLLVKLFIINICFSLLIPFPFIAKFLHLILGLLYNYFFLINHFYFALITLNY